MGLDAASAAAVRVGAWAAVRLVDGTVHRGVVYTVDPEVGQLVLLLPHPDKDATDAHATQPLILPAHAIEEVLQDESPSQEVLSRDATLLLASDDRPTSAPHDDLDLEASKERHRALTALLSSQRAPFEERSGGKLVILGCLHIDPPYTMRACRCENEIVLGRFLEMCQMSGLNIPP